MTKFSAVDSVGLVLRDKNSCLYKEIKAELNNKKKVFIKAMTNVRYTIRGELNIPTNSTPDVADAMIDEIVVRLNESEDNVNRIPFEWKREQTTTEYARE